MGYRHIDNLYKNNTILLFKQAYAMEKIDGTSSRISYKKGQINFHSGGAKHTTFVSIFDEEDLMQRFTDLGHEEVVVYGEAYGGKLQKMSATYGKQLKFCAFEVKIGDYWLRVQDAHDVANKLGLEFVHYELINCTQEEIDAQRDADSVQAIRNGCGEGKKREGIVLRPLLEFRDNQGKRILVKHKNDDFRETATPRKVGDKLEELAGEKAALEWVTDMRLNHVMDKISAELKEVLEIKHTGLVIKSMVEDVKREGEGEVDMNKSTVRAISTKARQLFHTYLKKDTFDG